MKVIIKNLQKKISLCPATIKEAVRKVLASEKVSKAAEITFLFTGDRQISELNLFYRGCAEATDVIAFDNSVDNKRILADIAISAQAACRNARIFKTAPLYELYLYVIHGVLHLLGYNDKTARQRDIMQQKAEGYLRQTIKCPSIKPKR